MASLPINIPVNFDILVKKGDRVHVGQVLARHSSSIKDAPSLQDTTECIVNLTSEFNARLSVVRKYLKKSPGDVLHKGDLLASKSSIFSLKKDNLISNVDGIILRFERDTGNLVIRIKPSDNFNNVYLNANPEIIVSPLDGIVTVCNNDAVVIKGEDNIFQGTSGSIGKTQGVLSTVHFKTGVEVKSSDLGVDDGGKILLVARIGREALAKAGALDVSGIITSNIDDADIVYLHERNISVPLVVVSEDVAEKLVKFDRENVFVDADARTISVKKE
jgi:hypothetical protein